MTPFDVCFIRVDWSKYHNFPPGEIFPLLNPCWLKCFIFFVEILYAYSCHVKVYMKKCLLHVCPYNYSKRPRVLYHLIDLLPDETN